MARLNEPPAPCESLESVKRRFLRQNRELAKHNSQQRERVRCLESEISRLLSENLALRQDILHLQNELEKRPETHAVDSVRDKLERKIQELGGLVTELAGLQIPPREPPLPKEPLQRPSPSSRRWALDPAYDDGRLPTIREDKLFPRKTLEAQEILRLSSGDLDSPDLGPPPVAQYQDEDPIEFPISASQITNDLLHSEDDGIIGNEKTGSESLPELSVNLETRRRRRDGESKLRIRRASIFNLVEEKSKSDITPSEAKPTDAPPGLRAGSKRKLSVREDAPKTVITEDAGFVFTRKATQPEVTNSSNEDSTPSTGQSRSRASRAALLSGKDLDRKALGEKCVNTDPIVSPKKPIVASGDKATLKPTRQSARDLKGKFRERKAVPRETTSSASADEPDTQDTAPSVEKEAEAESKPTANLVHAPLPPKTPSTLALLSPTSSNSSTLTSLPPRDTPPPTSDPSSTSLRPSRRARAAVNYAEPNLVSKMRRPTAELADAVDREGKPISGTMIVKETGSSQHNNNSPASSFLQGGASVTSVKESLPSSRIPQTQSPSPLVAKSTAIATVSATTGAEFGPLGDRGAVEDEEGRDAPSTERSAASLAISALLDRSASARSKPIFTSTPSTTGTSSSTVSTGGDDDSPHAVKTTENLTIPATTHHDHPSGPTHRRRASLVLFDIAASSSPEGAGGISSASKLGGESGDEHAGDEQRRKKSGLPAPATTTTAAGATGRAPRTTRRHSSLTAEAARPSASAEAGLGTRARDKADGGSGTGKVAGGTGGTKIKRSAALVAARSATREGKNAVGSGLTSGSEDESEVATLGRSGSLRSVGRRRSMMV